MQLEAEGEWLGDAQIFKFLYGNTHEEVLNPKASRDGKKLARHRWGVFVTINGNPELTARYIKSVTYHLHPTYVNPTIKTTEAPFLLTRLAWGYFEVRFEIEFREETGLGVKNLHHMLDFSGTGRTKNILL